MYCPSLWNLAPSGDVLRHVHNRNSCLLTPSAVTVGIVATAWSLIYKPDKQPSLNLKVNATCHRVRTECWKTTVLHYKEGKKQPPLLMSTEHNVHKNYFHCKKQRTIFLYWINKHTDDWLTFNGKIKGLFFVPPKKSFNLHILIIHVQYMFYLLVSFEYNLLQKLRNGFDN